MRSPRRWATGTAAVAAAVLVGAFWLDRWGHRDENLAEATAIVVLGAELAADDQPGPTLAARTRHAVALWQAQPTRQLVFSGHDARFQPSQAQAAAHLAHRLGVPRAAIWTEDESRDTWQNAQFTARLLLGRGVRNVILVSDPSHLWRASRHFRRFGLGVAVSGAVTSDALGAPLRVLKACREVFSVLRDVAFLRYWP